jgi:hypothetical protein
MLRIATFSANFMVASHASTWRPNAFIHAISFLSANAACPSFFLEVFEVAVVLTAKLAAS